VSSLDWTIRSLCQGPWKTPSHYVKKREALGNSFASFSWAGKGRQTQPNWDRAELSAKKYRRRTRKASRMYRNEDRTGALEEFKNADKQDGGQHIRDADGPGQNFPTTSRQRDKAQ